MATATLKGRASLSLTANDLERSLRFYEGLGFVIDERFEMDGRLQGAMLRTGDAPMGFRATDPDGFKIIICNRS